MCWKRLLNRVAKYIEMINFDDYTNENKTEHNPKWSYIPDHPHRILTVGVSRSGKINALLNLINSQPDIDIIYLYAKDPYVAKYQYFFNKREKVGLDHFNDFKASMGYSNDMSDVYKSSEDHKPNNKRKLLIIFDDMIADMINNKKAKFSSKLSEVQKLFIKKLFIGGAENLLCLSFLLQNVISERQKVLH